ncbi:DUF1381 domain-containing protein [Staphylococcus equorum]|uniref:DUF1381 domain-containing protein n=1 Tax=Staphylococcus equorum TaxID=246432 RepID=UPI002407DA17|nr:DUF1381 domain-containing protein [Staphylococcus equorum]MDG0821352.1 DUF1381 domain-containing protein [Staphylococcus equorum]
MTNYLIRHITDSTNHTFTEVIKPRENERYEIVSAESKEEAVMKYRVGKAFRNIKHFLENNKVLQEIRKDSE